MKTPNDKPLTRQDFVEWGRLGGKIKQINDRKRKKNGLPKPASDSSDSQQPPIRLDS